MNLIGGRFFRGKGITEVSGEIISSLDDLKEKIKHLISNHVHRDHIDHKEITFRDKHDIEEDLINKMLQELKVVNMCGTDRFSEQGVMISQNPMKQDARYNLEKLSDGKIQVDFKCSAQASKLGSKEVKMGEIAVKAVFNLNTNTFEVNRQFEEKMEQPSLQSKSNKRPK